MKTGCGLFFYLTLVIGSQIDAVQTDTNCANCNDNNCVSTTSCSECKTGFKPPECKEECEAHNYGINCMQQCSINCKGDECDSKTGHCECDSGYYGDKCDQQCNRRCRDDICDKGNGACECEAGYYGEDCDRCSGGCEDTCNSDSGRCSCEDWWDGNKCDTEVGIHKIQRYEVTLTDMTDSSVVVTWRTIRDLPDNTKQYYSYVLEYRVDGESEWTVVDRSFQHEPGADGTQQYTLIGLQYNTVYEVQVWSVRSLGELTDRTESTPEAQFTTKCKVPDKPTDLKITHEQDRNKVDLVITWKAPDHRCDRISDNDIDYRLSSASEDDWRNKDLRSWATSARITDLDPGEYVVRLTVTNNEDLSSSDTETYAAVLDYDTDCDKCDNADCVKTAPCLTCTPGYKQPECKKVCDSGDYGVNCAEDCSEGCEDTCDHVLGTCSCQQWWKGGKCTKEIKALQILQDDPKASSLTNSTAVIQWTKIVNVGLPTGLNSNYQYVIEYKEGTSSSWIEEQTKHRHDPSSHQYQEATLTGLMYNTVYDVRVKSYRVLGDDRDETGVTGEIQFKTECTAPSKPLKVSVTSQDIDGKLTLRITWEPPNIVGCNKILGYSVLYRLKPPSSDTWVTDASLSTCTSHTLELDPGDYVVRIEATNDGNSSDSTSSAQVTYYNQRDAASNNAGKDGSGNTGLIAGLVIALVVIAVLVGAAALVLYRNKQLKQEVQELKKDQSPDTAYEIVEPAPTSVSMVTPDLEEMPENQYEKPVSYENAAAALAKPVYEALRVP